jgi:antitoxin (DNA-binding transcriptional repressor) of toxin-antitoxin stability system
MKRVPLDKVQARLVEYVETSAKQPVLILRDGEPVAILVGLYQSAKRTPIKLREVLKRAWKDFEDHGGIPHEQFWNDLPKSAKKPGTRGDRDKRGLA